jgi:hypothetical protein
MRASTVVTTNLAFKDWGNLFHNAAAATGGCQSSCRFC